MSIVEADEIRNNSSMCFLTLAILTLHFCQLVFNSLKILSCQASFARVVAARTAIMSELEDYIATVRERETQTWGFAIYRTAYGATTDLPWQSLLEAIRTNVRTEVLGLRVPREETRPTSPTRRRRDAKNSCHCSNLMSRRTRAFWKACLWTVYGI